jgi:hypothetical protein
MLLPMGEEANSWHFKAVYGIDGRPTAAQLISFLLDERESQDVRDDAAMDLHEFDDQEAETALLWVASSGATPSTLHARVGESLAEIWARRGGFTREKFLGLQPEARSEVATFGQQAGCDWNTA